MSKKVKNILSEIDSLVPERNKHSVVEARASNIITSAINLIDLIEENYSERDAELLTRQILNSIKNKDRDKFSKKIKRMKREDDN